MNTPEHRPSPSSDVKVVHLRIPADVAEAVARLAADADRPIARTYVRLIRAALDAVTTKR